jgi:hypothetical protein
MLTFAYDLTVKGLFIIYILMEPGLPYSIRFLEVRYGSVKLCVREKVENFAQGIEQFMAKVVTRSLPKRTS